MFNESDYQFYDDSYRFVTPNWLSFENQNVIDSFLEKNNETMIDFIDDFSGKFDLQKNSFLECGCGLGGLSIKLSSSFTDCYGVDVSNLAIMGANRICELKNISNSQFQVGDLTKEINLKKQFDLIADSHLLHCLTDSSHRQNYFDFIKKHLSKSGYFLVECMTFQKNIDFPMEYELTDSSDIIHQGKKIRRLLTTHELEQEFLSAGFKINYLFYHDELAFDLFTDYKHYPHEKLPKTTRVGLSLN